MYGETYDPSESESAACLRELGYRLIDYCKAPLEKRALAAKFIEKQAKWFDRYLRTHRPNNATRLTSRCSYTQGLRWAI
jgi:hypothetical protein